MEDQGAASEEDKVAAAKSGEEIYIGFDKSDAAPRKGRKGRVLNDDPSRYPKRDELSGGWAGGEVGLQKFVEEAAAKGETTYQKAKVVETTTKDGKVQKKAITEDGEEIYLGFSKSDMDIRKQGGKGRSIRDDPSRYPDKEDVGILPQVTGGFAGGEMGVKQFVESGDIKLSPKGKPQFSSVALAIFVIFGVSTGAILLNSGVMLSEQALGGGSEASGGPLTGVLSSSLTNSIVVDEKTKLLLNASFVVLGLGALLLGGRAVSKRLSESTTQLKDDAVNAAKISVFVLVVLLGALYVLDY